jgi:hypothetical protein
MPEAAMDEDDGVVLVENDVGFAGQTVVINGVGNTAGLKGLLNELFEAGIGRGDIAHSFACGGVSRREQASFRGGDGFHEMWVLLRMGAVAGLNVEWSHRGRIVDVLKGQVNSCSGLGLPFRGISLVVSGVIMRVFVRPGIGIGAGKGSVRK